MLCELAKHAHGARFRRLAQVCTKECWALLCACAISPFAAAAYVLALQQLVQLVLFVMSSLPIAPLQELEAHAAALHGPVVWKMRQWFTEPGAPGCLVALQRVALRAGAAWHASAVWLSLFGATPAGQPARKRHSPGSLATGLFMLSPAGQPESHYAVAALLSDILASSASGAPPASEVAKLHRFYWPQDPVSSGWHLGGGTPSFESLPAALAPLLRSCTAYLRACDTLPHPASSDPLPTVCPQGQEIPPIAFLRHPRIIEVLLINLFSPSRQLQPEAVHAYSGLLALAAAANDQRPNGPADDAAAAADAAGGGGEQHQQHGGGGGRLDLAAVPATRAALEAAAELAQRVMQDQKSTQEDMETAAAVLEYPICAAGARHIPHLHVKQVASPGFTWPAAGAAAAAA